MMNCCSTSPSPSSKMVGWYGISVICNQSAIAICPSKSHSRNPAQNTPSFFPDSPVRAPVSAGLNDAYSATSRAAHSARRKGFAREKRVRNPSPAGKMRFLR